MSNGISAIHHTALVNNSLDIDFNRWHGNGCKSFGRSNGFRLNGSYTDQSNPATLLIQVQQWTDSILSLFLHVIVHSKRVAAPPSAHQRTTPCFGRSGLSHQQPRKRAHSGARAWLRSLRRQANLIQDPLLTDYLENLIYQLASYSDIDSPDIELVIILSPIHI